MSIEKDERISKGANHQCPTSQSTDLCMHTSLGRISGILAKEQMAAKAEKLVALGTRGSCHNRNL